VTFKDTLLALWRCC